MPVTNGWRLSKQRRFLLRKGENLIFPLKNQDFAQCPLALGTLAKIGFYSAFGILLGFFFASTQISSNISTRHFIWHPAFDILFSIRHFTQQFIKEGPTWPVFKSDTTQYYILFIHHNIYDNSASLKSTNNSSITLSLE